VTLQELLSEADGVVEHPGLEAVAAEEYDGDEECDYGCGSTAEYRVQLRLNGRSTMSLMCNGCSQAHKIWVEENDLLQVPLDPLAKVAGQTEVEIACAVAMDAPRGCDGWSETVDLDEPARYVDDRITLPGFSWECPECGNPHEFEIDGIRVSNLV
jgi:hypothetical protein